MTTIGYVPAGINQATACVVVGLRPSRELELKRPGERGWRRTAEAVDTSQASGPVPRDNVKDGPDGVNVAPYSNSNVSRSTVVTGRS